MDGSFRSRSKPRRTRVPVRVRSGYQWGPIMLRNGTKIRLHYKGKVHHAAVKFGKIEYEDSKYSPSELASKIAGGTARNAWRDLWIQEPFNPSEKWVRADELRRKARGMT